MASTEASEAREPRDTRSVSKVAAAEQQRSIAGQIGLDRFIERPRLAMRPPETLLLVDEGPALPPLWRRIGWPFPLLAAFSVLLWQIAQGGHAQPGATLTALALVGLSAGLFLKRPRPHELSRAPRALAAFDRQEGTIVLLRDSDQTHPGEGPSLSWQDVRELIYARREVAIPAGRTRLMGGGLFLRTWEGAVWSLVPSTLDADEVYSMGKRIAAFTGFTLKQAGAGFVAKRTPS